MPPVKRKDKLHNLRPDKRLGQHFLRDTGVVREIIDRADLRNTDRILEVGPGLGALTIPLAAHVHEVIGVEKDLRLANELENKIYRAGITNVTLIKGDILKVDLEKALPHSGKSTKVIGNLPYNISSPFLEKIINHKDFIKKAILMFQFEFANRLLASPGGKDYGSLTVLTRYHAAVSELLQVSKNSFYPRPKVGSMVVALDMEKPYPKRAEDERLFRMVVKGAFAHRRKTVLNSLKGALRTYKGEEITISLKACSIDAGRRAETIHIDEFLNLATELKRTKEEFG